ncbi:ERF family protein [Endozoicomonas acroporae]|uniref:ERF family protein n=1 Tax=Endozoicomonas acroporae TaxID=1701104 RepID=UPI0013D7ECCF|nr:ERF family protein [Endozoicomonas acroporae]
MKLYEQGQEILAKQQFNHAFAAFQKELPVVKKSKTASFPTSKGGTMSYSYASMDDVVQAVQPVLHKVGLSYWFEQLQEQVQTQKEFELQPGITETRPVTVTVITITCHLGHVSGHSISNTVSGPMDSSGKKNPIQQMSSAVTYLRRIALVGILGVACTDEDVDGYSPDIPEPTVQASTHYTDEDFQRNLPTWRDLIENRKSNADEIITLINSKAPATPKQVKQLKAIKAIKQEVH